jgi:hypothetical protein
MDALVATGRSLSRSGPSEDFLALLTETVNTEAHDVARLEILRRLHAEAHSRRGARGDLIAGHERKELAEIAALVKISGSSGTGMPLSAA